MKICDLTQFYSPVSGGVRRYVEQKVGYVRHARPDCQHILVVPGETTESHGDQVSRVYTIASPLVSRTSRYRALLKLHLVEEVLEKERPDIIESGDPYQLAWKAVASGRGLDIPVVGFYHSHFPEAYIRSVAKYFGQLAIAIAEDMSRRYVRTLYNSLERTFVPSPTLATLLRTLGCRTCRKYRPRGRRRCFSSEWRSFRLAPARAQNSRRTPAPFVCRAVGIGKERSHAF